MSRAAPAALPETEFGNAIRRLPASVAAQIAAGEVIERPASVVKELLENAADAGATRIEVLIEGAGLERIRVTDNGRGMSADELPLAFERHATSKLSAADDLWALRSYGFRGEALPSIVAVAEVDCISRPRDPRPGRSDSGAGTRLRFRGGSAQALETAAAPPGTILEVQHLFARQPARRKFLRGDRAERAAIARVCGDQALALPRVALQLTMEGRRALRSGGEGQRRAVLAELWGAPAAEAALAFAGTQPRAGMRVEGLAAPPQYQRAHRGELRLFVNGRAVQSRRLSYALQEAYRELLPARRFPLVALFLEVDPARVDVNVHPTKAQVKLSDEDVAFGLIQRSLREALLTGRTSAGPAPIAAATSAAPSAARSAARPLSTWDRAGLPTLERPGPRSAPDPAEATAAEGQPELPGAASPPLRVLGQIDAAFLVAEGPDGLYLVDQHAAHERVLYERLLEAAAAPRSASQQALLDLDPIELSAAQAGALTEFAPALRALGWDVEPFGERALRLRALPAALARALGGESSERRLSRDPAGCLTALLDELAQASPASLSAEEPQRFDPAAAASACHSAVRAGDPLAPEEQRALLRALEDCARSQTCPHGRPTLLRLPREEILRRFLRR